MPDPLRLRSEALAILTHAIAAADPADAVNRAVQLTDKGLSVGDYPKGKPIYVIGLGKAATSMAQGLERTLGSLIKRGVISDPRATGILDTARWLTFSGGHPVPNQASLDAARAALTLIEDANCEEAIIIFLISGGGSAMMEWPITQEITLSDLQLTNQVLITSGASINEINCVRRALSAVKGGGLTRRLTRAKGVSLIVADTNSGDESSVASGPTISSPAKYSFVRDVITKYQLDATLPASVLKVLGSLTDIQESYSQHPYYVILENQTCLNAAASKAASLGFTIIIDNNISEQPIELGVELLMRRLKAAGPRTCLLSGGEFSCPVRGNGQGGRNLETVLRCAIQMESEQLDDGVVVLSAGTDGIDGNSAAAGAIADVLSVQRGRALGLDATDFLERSDSYSFFERLGDLILTGPTGTNVRDLRIILTDSSLR